MFSVYSKNKGIGLTVPILLEGSVYIYIYIYIYIYTYTHIYTYIYAQSWSELLAPLVNMIKGGCENEFALLILLIFYLKKSQKYNLSLENKNLKWEEISL